MEQETEMETKTERKPKKGRATNRVSSLSCCCLFRSFDWQPSHGSGQSSSMHKARRVIQPGPKAKSICLNWTWNVDNINNSPTACLSLSASLFNCRSNCLYVSSTVCLSPLVWLSVSADRRRGCHSSSKRIDTNCLTFFFQQLPALFVVVAAVAVDLWTRRRFACVDVGQS